MAAILSTAFGAELRRLRQRAGMSLTDLADRIHYSKSYLSKVENGRARPQEAMALLCDAEFGSSGTLAALAPTAPTKGQRRSPIARLAGLPAVTPHFTGRTDEARAIRDALLADASGGASVCAVSGLVGVGKTALAVRCALQLRQVCPDGCLFVPLRGSTPGGAVPPADALRRVLRFLGVSAREMPRDLDDRSTLYRDLLTGRRVVVLLDDVESVYQILPLLPAEPRCRVLVTSRRRLVALDDACHIGLGVLPVADARSLLRALLPDRVMPGDDSAMDRVLDRCGRLPLAVRIAAARLDRHPGWRLADLATRLADDAATMSELDDGERSLAAAFELSHRALPDDARRLFDALAARPGVDVTAECAASLCGVGQAAAERLLDVLCDHHVIVRSGADRYRIQDLVGTFARSRTYACESQVSAAAGSHPDPLHGGRAIRPRVVVAPAPG